MTLTTIPTTRPSSSTTTTSFDLRSARRHRGAMGTAAGVAATVRRPVWCGQRRSGGSPADGNARRTRPGCAHCAESVRAIDRRSRAAIALAAYPHPTGQAVIVALRRAQRPVWAPECESWADRPLFAGDRALRRSSIASRGSGGVAQPREDDRPTGVLVTRCRGLPSPNRDRRAAPCPARLGADRAVPAADGRRRPVGRRFRSCRGIRWRATSGQPTDVAVDSAGGRLHH